MLTEYTVAGTVGARVRFSTDSCSVFVYVNLHVFKRAHDTGEIRSVRQRLKHSTYKHTAHTGTALAGLIYRLSTVPSMVTTRTVPVSFHAYYFATVSLSRQYMSC